MLPGLADAHCHLAMLGEQLTSLDLTDVRTLEEMVRRTAATAPADGWVLGRGWDLPEFPTNRELRSDVAVWLVRKDCHSGLANAKALALAGMADRDGMLFESDMERIERVLPRRDRAAFVRAAEEHALRLGITSVHDACVTEALPPTRLRVHEMRWRSDQRPTPGARAIKLFMDGSLGSGTAWMLDGRGVSRLTAADVRAAAASGSQLCVHAIGTRAVREALDGLEGATGRHRIEHAQHVDLDDIPRFRGLIASMQPSHAIADERMMRERLTERERAGSYAFAALAAAGARLVFGSDAPVERMDPRWTFDCATRCGVAPEAALRAMTVDAAYAAFMEGQVGTIRPRMRADFTVVSDDWTRTAAMGTEVLATIINGEILVGGETL